MDLVTLPGIEAARRRFDDPGVVRETPVESNRSLSAFSGADVHLKMEHLQRTGSFKTRGAYNKLSQVGNEEGVSRAVAASAGNHAQGVALAATEVGLESTIVMPTDAPQTKIDATRGYGARVELHGSHFPVAMERAREIAAEEGTVFVHAYDDREIVAGQGTLGLEIYEAVRDVDTVIVPIGGGGLISGISAALAGLNPDVRVIGVQADGAATVPDSLQKGEPQSHDSPNTIADGIATGGISEFTLAHIDAHVDRVVTVSDDEIAMAVLLCLERTKQLVEGAGAASIAALLSDDVDLEGERVVALLCGGNIDMSMLQAVLTHALVGREQLLRLRVRITDRPGRMAEISGLMSEHGANIREVRHDRAVDELDVGEAYLVFEVLTSGTEHAARVTASVEEAGYDVQRMN
ncbi:threonine ammonia-lyase [Halobacteriales archaeon QS_8_65_32]|jgi:threonine dehydratase|nr:MAG: threonine ammonia-lyase [Halobacteriales archaeon QS_8_65_32]